MKLISFASIFLILQAAIVIGAAEGPIAMYFPSADAIYFVRVSSSNDKTINFSVIETLRGSKKESLTRLDGRLYDFKANSEWLLLSNADWRKIAGDKDEVGSFMKGIIGWICAPVVRSGNDVYVYTDLQEGDHLVSDKTIDGLPYLTLDHVRRLIQEEPGQSPSKKN
jgi:hypothetical protein